MSTQVKHEPTWDPDAAPNETPLQDPVVAEAARKSVPVPGHHEAEAGAVVGAIAGAVMGAIAGPPGIAVGTALGAAAGAAAGASLGAENIEREQADKQLDKDIGVTEGDLGAPTLRHPPATHGLYSGAAAGSGGIGGRAPSEGPIPSGDD